jgi:hypothetical protein
MTRGKLLLSATPDVDTKIKHIYGPISALAGGTVTTQDVFACSPGEAI